MWLVIQVLFGPVEAVKNAILKLFFPFFLHVLLYCFICVVFNVKIRIFAVSKLIIDAHIVITSLLKEKWIVVMVVDIN